ncbi:MAG TPA: rhodanese-like domain-containing protein [Methylococcus sp.]|nr:rhodanese-like domain-containing protein [Methylococcus sp.]
MTRLLEFLGNHWIMASAWLVVTVLLLQDLIESLFRKHKVISATGAVALLNSEGTLVIDVREPHEYAEGHIDGARHIPLGKLEERISELDAYKDASIIVTCQQGTRSPHACKILTKHGFRQVHEMRGGMLAWKDANFPITKKRKKA